MERRREPRLKIGKSVTLIVLDVARPGDGRRIEAFVLDLSGSGMRLRLPSPVPCGAAVEVDDEHTLVLGEICRCVPQEDGAYDAAVRIHEIYTSGSEIDRLHQALKCYETPVKDSERTRS